MPFSKAEGCVAQPPPAKKLVSVCPLAQWAASIKTKATNAALANHGVFVLCHKCIGHYKQKGGGAARLPFIIYNIISH